MCVSVKRIADLIEPTIRALGLELWTCDLHQSGHHALLRIYIDRQDEQGVTLEDCALVSREVSAILDVEDPIKNHYHLEVSSPGIDRTLSTLSHFQRYVGCEIKVKLRVAISNKKHFIARIEKVDGEKIFLTTENEIIKLGLGEIHKASLVER
ncbi:MAG: hypothetical protein A3C44_07030 [Gammaproteobacteria bacterium RIFCSPHIGHO2_02_FULL_39_13]|nr:MAG: hypothetical protein A3C44_07030 [Gammaproteobacteria bacterium RIFCSPHIGHO2_02_FULL_39_13]OGT49989.1 MAG: hypothetical protein A3E53_02135 [Gammaproteobacteria bacterium RIFCSPHIGHO2_12_FULL_39_24]